MSSKNDYNGGERSSRNDVTGNSTTDVKARFFAVKGESP